MAFNSDVADVLLAKVCDRKDNTLRLLDALRLGGDRHIHIKVLLLEDTYFIRDTAAEAW